MKSARRIQKEYREMVAARKVNDAVEAAWDADMMNEDLEKEFDRTYNIYMACWTKLVKTFMDYTDCTFDVAKAAVASEKFEHMMSLTIVD